MQALSPEESTVVLQVVDAKWCSSGHFFNYLNIHQGLCGSMYLYVAFLLCSPDGGFAFMWLLTTPFRLLTTTYRAGVALCGCVRPLPASCGLIASCGLKLAVTLPAEVTQHT